MSIPKKPLPFGELDTRPPLSPQPRISADIQQALSLLCGYDGSQRVLLKTSPIGVLYTASPRVKGILNILADQASYNFQGMDISSTEVLVISNPDNNARLWVNIGAAAGVNTGYPLDAGDWVRFSVNNLRSLHLHIIGDTEKASIIYTI